MSDKPILFSAPMVRALLDGRKTQTRRILKPWPGMQAKWLTAETLHTSPSCHLTTVDGHLGAQMQHPMAGTIQNGIAIDTLSPLTWVRLPYTHGDRLWVREAHYMTDDGYSEYAVFAEDHGDVAAHLAEMQTLMASHPNVDWSKHLRLRSPIHMPRWASRLTLIVTDVRVQRLQDISRGDAVAEGIEQDPATMAFWGADGQGVGGATTLWAHASMAFRDIWNSIHGPAAWGANPWVCAISFTVIPRNIDQIGGEA